MVAAMTMFSFSSEDVQERFISAEQLMRVCDQVWSADSKAEITIERSQPPAGSCVYCKVDHLIGLFDQDPAGPQSRGPRQLGKRSADHQGIPCKDARRRSRIGSAQTFKRRTSRLSALPLGLANSYCDITLKAPLIAAHSRPFAERSRWLYVNFRTTSNPAVREPVHAPFPQLEKCGLGDRAGSRAGL